MNDQTTAEIWGNEPTSSSGRDIDALETTLTTILQTAEYVSDRTAHVQTNIREGVHAGETLSAVARQIRTLSTNTSLEASRLGGSATIGEIARQMRLLSQQVTVLSEHLSAGLRSQNVALGELSGAVDALLVETSSTQASLHDAIPPYNRSIGLRRIDALEQSMEETGTNG